MCYTAERGTISFLQDWAKLRHILRIIKSPKASSLRWLGGESGWTVPLDTELVSWMDQRVKIMLFVYMSNVIFCYPILYILLQGQSGH